MIDRRTISLDRELIYRTIKYVAICDMGAKKTLDSFIYVNFKELNGSYSHEELDACLHSLSNEMIEYLLLKMVE